MKKQLYTQSVLTAFLVLLVLLYGCLTKDPNPKFREPRIDTTPRPNPITTIPGNNIFTTNGGSLVLWLSNDSMVTHTYHAGRCDTSGGRYVMTMQSSVPGWAFVNIFFHEKPTESKQLTAVPYLSVPLSDTAVWVVVTRVIENDGKVWIAKEGKVNVSVDAAGLVSATFLRLPVQNFGNFTDTALTHISASLFCR